MLDSCLVMVKHGQNGRGERTRGGIVLLAQERNFPKIVNEPNIPIFKRIVILGEYTPSQM